MIRQCDTGIATSLIAYEKSEDRIEESGLTPTLQQLSATLQARLVGITAKEAFATVDATEGQGIEAWRQLGKRFDPRRMPGSPFS